MRAPSLPVRAVSGSRPASWARPRKPGDGRRDAGREPGPGGDRDLVDDQRVHRCPADQGGGQPRPDPRAPPGGPQHPGRAPGRRAGPGARVGDRDGGEHERDRDRAGLGPDRGPPPGRAGEPGGQREVDGAGHGAEQGQPDDGPRGRRGRGPGGGRLRDVVKAERPDQAAAARVGDGEREQRALHRGGEHRAGPGGARDQETGPRAAAVQDPARNHPPGTGDDQRRAEDRAERRIRPARIGGDRPDQHAIGVITRAIADDREHAEHRDRHHGRPRPGISALVPLPGQPGRRVHQSW